ncbi:MAG TPA: endolytic transglycosylase MltG [Acidimicrobiales bacterium]|nr:endolytic transglycosylase MltG [Acidimicrobiales bacterium]
MLSSAFGRVVLGVLVLIVLVAGWFFLQVDPVFAGKGKEVIVTVQEGESVSAIAGELHAKGVIASPFAFRVENLILGTPLVRSGSYEMRQGSSFASVRSILGSAPNVGVVTVTAGLTLHEVALDVAAQKGNAYADRFVHAATAANTPSSFSDGSSLEGLIGVGTYVIKPSVTPGALAHEMVDRFAKEAVSVGLSATTTTGGLDAYQTIIAASIVEKEGYYPRNMPKVARVIFNRLARGGPLQMDATVLYALGKDGGTVTPAMLQTPSPYNTYLNTGLTPTPICAVSTTALRAVLHAPAGPWLYFTVINKRGDEAFSTTFTQQLKNEAIGASNGIS